MILEGLLTTVDAEGRVNIAPMGPIVDESMRRLVLRPFRDSTTFANLSRSRQGVFHVDDDVLRLAQAAVGEIDPAPIVRPATTIEGVILSDACRWYAVRVVSIDASHARAEMVAEVVDQGVQREFFGFNRAKHAVLEAAILATRVHLIPRDQLEPELDRLGAPVSKTGGPREQQAFAFLRQYIRSQAAAAP